LALSRWVAAERSPELLFFFFLFVEGGRNLSSVADPLPGLSGPWRRPISLRVTLEPESPSNSCATGSNRGNHADRDLQASRSTRAPPTVAEVHDSATVDDGAGRVGGRKIRPARLGLVGSSLLSSGLARSFRARKYVDGRGGAMRPQRAPALKRFCNAIALEAAACSRRLRDRRHAARIGPSSAALTGRSITNPTSFFRGNGLDHRRGWRWASSLNGPGVARNQSELWCRRGLPPPGTYAPLRARGNRRAGATYYGARFALGSGGRNGLWGTRQRLRAPRPRGGRYSRDAPARQAAAPEPRAGQITRRRPPFPSSPTILLTGEPRSPCFRLEKCARYSVLEGAFKTGTGTRDNARQTGFGVRLYRPASRSGGVGGNSPAASMLTFQGSPVLARLVDGT